MWSSGDGTCSCQAEPSAACNGAAWDVLFSFDRSMCHWSMCHWTTATKVRKPLSQSHPSNFCLLLLQM